MIDEEQFVFLYELLEPIRFKRRIKQSTPSLRVQFAKLLIREGFCRNEVIMFTNISRSQYYVLIKQEA